MASYAVDALRAVGYTGGAAVWGAVTGATSHAVGDAVAHKTDQPKKHGEALSKACVLVFSSMADDSTYVGTSFRTAFYAMNLIGAAGSPAFFAKKAGTKAKSKKQEIGAAALTGLGLGAATYLVLWKFHPVVASTAAAYVANYFASQPFKD